jgi:hypothetical protein
MRETESHTQKSECPTRQPWVRPRLKSAGNVSDVLQGGGGKLSPMAHDPGDTRKPAGQG